MIYNISVGWEYTVWLSLLRGKTLVRQLLWICMLTPLNASCLLMYAWLSATRHLLNCIIFRLQWGTNLYENQIRKNSQRDKREIHLPCSSPQSTNVKTHLGNWPDLTPWTTVRLRDVTQKPLWQCHRYWNPRVCGSLRLGLLCCSGNGGYNGASKTPWPAAAAARH